MSRFHERLRLEAELKSLEETIDARWTTLPKRTGTDVALHEAGCQLQKKNPDFRSLSPSELVIQILSRICEMTYVIDDAALAEKNFTSVWNLNGAALYVIKRWDDGALHVPRKAKVVSRESERRAWWKAKRKEHVEKEET